MTKRSGKCLCGAVRFTAEAESHHHACHCSMCRRWCGGAPFFGAPAQNVVFEGEEQIARYPSSTWAVRGFCKTCGSNLFYFLKPTQSYSMCIGAFDDAEAFELEQEIYIDHKPAGYALTGEHPRLTEAETLAAFAPKD